MRGKAMGLLLTGAATMAHAQSMVDQLAGPWPIKTEGNYHARIPDDGKFHIDGNWSVPYGGSQPVQILLKDAVFEGPGHHLHLVVPAGQYAGAEFYSNKGWSPDNGTTYPYGTKGYRYGYYEVIMKVANVGNSANNTGVANSFFLKGAPCCGVSPEIDFEFLTNESWLKTSKGQVHCTVHWGNAQISDPVPLSFNPSTGFHRYGMLFAANGSVKFYADRKLIDTISNSGITMPSNGLGIWANAWTGNPNWGGLPPAAKATAAYQWTGFWANVTAPPSLK